MIGYWTGVDLVALEQQVLEEFDAEAPYNPLWIPKGSGRKSPEEPEAARELISEGFLQLQAGNRYGGYAKLKAASDSAPRSLLSLVTGDLARSINRHIAAGECYGRVKFCDPLYYKESVARQGRVYTEVLKSWRRLGLLPTVVITWGGEGANMFLLELIPDPAKKPTRPLTASMKKRIRSLGKDKPVYIELWVNSIMGEEFENGEWPVYGASRVLGMGPYIFSAEKAVLVAKSYADALFSDYDNYALPTWRKMPDYEDYESIASHHRLPLECFKYIENNETLARGLIYGGVERRLLPGRERWFDHLKSIEPKTA